MRTGWLNSAPLSPAGLRGHVVLVDFWTFTCINWLRTEPYVRGWSRAYRDDGLVVIGVHTPEFSFEHEIDRVRRATEEREIDYPVAVDNDYEIWSAFANHYWPALYFVDANGNIRDHHFGEGRYEESERVIQRLLGSIGSPSWSKGSAWRPKPTGKTCGRPRRISATGAASVSRHRRRRARRAAAYEIPERLRLNQWALAGTGRSAGEGRTGPGRWKHRLPVPRAGRASRAVPGAREPIPFRVLLDGEAPGPSHGVDVDEDGNGLLRDGRLYQLVRQPDPVRERTLKITFPEPGAEAYVFTFG